MKTKLLCLALMIPGMANAQVLLEQTQAESGSYYKGVLSVIQGCNGSATTTITVDIPEGLQFVQPMPKAGWQLEIVKKPVERPFFRDGIEITEAVRQITWSGSTLSDNHFDEFIFRGRIGVGATSVLYFPVIQTCEGGELHWDQIAETKPTKKTMPKEAAPEGVIDMMEDVEDRDEEHQHDHAKMDDHQMEMTDTPVEMNHSAHAGHGGHGQSTLQYPAPFVKIVDGTGEHHHH